MARITVPYTMFEEGRFPPVCCKTGVSADRYTRWKFVQTPGWTWILLPFGVIPFLIVRSVLTREFEGVLPITTRVEKRVRRVTILAIVTAIAGVACFLGALVAVGWGSVLGLVLLGAAAVLLVLAHAWSPSAHRDVDRGTVELRNVHGAFVQAVEATWSTPPPPVAPPPVAPPPVAEST